MDNVSHSFGCLSYKCPHNTIWCVEDPVSASPRRGILLMFKVWIVEKKFIDSWKKQPCRYKMTGSSNIQVMLGPYCKNEGKQNKSTSSWLSLSLVTCQNSDPVKSLIWSPWTAEKSVVCSRKIIHMWKRMAWKTKNNQFKSKYNQVTSQLDPRTSALVFKGHLQSHKPSYSSAPISESYLLLAEEALF